MWKISGLAAGHKAAREKLKLLLYEVTAVREFKPTDREKRTRHCEWV